MSGNVDFESLLKARDSENARAGAHEMFQEPDKLALEQSLKEAIEGGAHSLSFPCAPKVAVAIREWLSATYPLFGVTTIAGVDAAMLDAIRNQELMAVAFGMPILPKGMVEGLTHTLIIHWT